VTPRRTPFAKLLIYSDMREAMFITGYVETFGWREREVVIDKHWFKMPQTRGPLCG